MNQKISKYHLHCILWQHRQTGLGMYSGFWEGRGISKTIPGKQTNVLFDAFAKWDTKET